VNWLFFGAVASSLVGMLFCVLAGMAIQSRYSGDRITHSAISSLLLVGCVFVALGGLALGRS
jgi:hypothetical protein